MDGSDNIHGVMIECLQSFCEIGELFDRAGMFPTDEEHADLMNLDKRFFDSYHDLHEWAKSKEKKLFNKVSKLHSMHHMLLDARFLNPRFHWNFRAEDYVGAISRLGHSVSFGLKATRISDKLCQKYMVLLHLHLSKPGFAMKDDF